ncbi:MAG: cyclodeaminase/cyclohydrolase family protein [Anaerolineae bacterium]|nr:cyclodeaminase/cyclohydrolase family protein [Anaerolineae bacterium]
MTHPDDTRFIERLAEGTPAPGGGAAAAHTGALGAALVGMAARLTLGREKYAESWSRAVEIATEADSLRAALLEAAGLDEDAFSALLAAYRLPKQTDAEQTVRAEAVVRAARLTVDVPLGVAWMCIRVLDLALEIARIGNVNASADAHAGACLARAALEAVTLNIRINLADDAPAPEQAESVGALPAYRAHAAQVVEQIQAAVAERTGVWIGE